MVRVHNSTMVNRTVQNIFCFLSVHTAMRSVQPSCSFHLDLTWQKQDFCSDGTEHKTEELHEQPEVKVYFHLRGCKQTLFSVFSLLIFIHFRRPLPLFAEQTLLSSYSFSHWHTLTSCLRQGSGQLILSCHASLLLERNPA